MSALARLLEQATPGLGQTMWTTNAEPENWRLVLSLPDVRLIALAPDMARLLIDMADALNLVVRDEPGDWDAFLDQSPTELLARFAELEQRAAP